MSNDQQSRWRDERSTAAAVHAEALERRRLAEAARARELVAGFVVEATRRGLRTTRLRAVAYSGDTTYRTGLHGWYLLRRGTLAVDTAGEFYVLTVPDSLRSRLTGVDLSPSDPPLAVGRGARDGESMSLASLLTLRLEAGDSWRCEPG